VIVLEFKKAIGKMGNLAKVGAEKAGQAVKEGYSEAKTNYPEVKHRVGKAAQKANRAANRGMDYAVRVRNNASESQLFKEPAATHGRHEESERFFMGPAYEKAEHKRHKRSGQTFVINVNNTGRKKKRKHQDRRSGFSLI
jgi:hypothetical protein